MFRKLKIQLITINLALLILVLAIIFSGIYFSMAQGMERQSKDTMRRIAQSEHLQPFGPPQPPQQPQDQHPAPDYFYLKLSANRQILEASPNLPVSTGDAQGLIDKTVSDTRATGTTSYNNVNYRYLKASKGHSLFLVFNDKTHDEEVLARLVIISLTIGGLSLVMVFFISLYLANRAIVPIKRAWDKQKAFVADASHELRTPLAVVYTNLELVLGNVDETVGSQSKWLGNIQSEVQRMSKLVGDLLFLARTDADEPIAMNVFPLSDAVNQAVIPFVPFAAAKGVELIAVIEPDVVFYGNEGRIKQLMAILIDNAVKHTAGGGKVEIRLATGTNALEIAVSDTGEGIPKEHFDRIFERFYRVDQSRSREHGGTGLGLSIADSIIKEHRGAISVSSSVGKGATFNISFPKPKTIMNPHP